MMHKFTFGSVGKIVSLTFFLCISFQLKGVPLLLKNDSVQVTQNDSVEQKDIVEIVTQFLKIRSRKDSAGKGPFFSLLPGFGYALQSGFTGVLTSSVSFFTSSREKKISNVSATASYSEYQQFWASLNNYVFLHKPKLHFYGDWRYYKFPTKTYGFGNRSSFADVLNIDYKYIRFYQSVFQQITENMFAGIGYALDDHWNISEQPASGNVYQQIHYQQKGNHSVSAGITLNFKYDNRRNSVNPQCGTYASFLYRPNFTFLGSDENWQDLLIDLRHYFRFPASSKNILAFWNYDNIILHGMPSYLDMPSTGWDDYSNTGRGYVPGRYRGKNLWYFETEYRMVFTKNGLLGGVVFGNLQTYPWDPSDIFSKIIPAGGLGLRIKINRFSNTNLAIDYGFGIQNSRGFFFNLGEVF